MVISLDLPQNSLGSYCPINTTPSLNCPDPWPRPLSPHALWGRLFKSLLLWDFGRSLNLVVWVNWNKSESLVLPSAMDSLPTTLVSSSNVEGNLLKSCRHWAGSPCWSLTSKTAECLFRELLRLPVRLIQTQTLFAHNTKAMSQSVSKAEFAVSLEAVRG